MIKYKAEKRQTVVERILENDDTTSHSTHREAPQEVLKPHLFPRTSLEKKRMIAKHHIIHY
jgi:hypothetical protein